MPCFEKRRCETRLPTGSGPCSTACACVEWRLAADSNGASVAFSCKLEACSYCHGKSFNSSHASAKFIYAHLRAFPQIACSLSAVADDAPPAEHVQPPAEICKLLGPLQISVP